MLTNEKRAELLDDLADIEGFETVDELLEARGMDSVMPAICTKCGSGGYEYEPDCRDGWCDECDSNSVQSLLVLMEII